MTGINLDKLEQVIKTNNKLLEEANDSLNDLETSINELSDCYEGYSLNSIYSIVKSQNNNLMSIDMLINSYLTMLDTVKNTYLKQDLLFGEQLDGMIKKI